MKLIVVLCLCAMARGKILIEKMDFNMDPKLFDVKFDVKDKHTISIDAHALVDAEDIIVQMAVYSKVDGNFNLFIRPDPIKVCIFHEHEDPLIKFMHDEIVKYGNVTKACPIKKGEHYVLHDFSLDDKLAPVPLPDGEFRVDVNSSLVHNGVTVPASNSQYILKTVKA